MGEREVLDSLKLRLESNFKKLDIVIATSISKKMKTNWSSVKEWMGRLVDQFELIDLAELVYLCPEAFQLKWEIVVDEFSGRKGFELVIYLLRPTGGAAEGTFAARAELFK